jgi:DNA-binding SARP family transcriptional activator
VLLLSILPAGAAKTSGTSSVRPADGRLRGQDFAAQVTQVAWPDQAVVNGRDGESTTGHRFVVFTLQLAENTVAVSPRGSDPPVTASVRYGQVVRSLSLTGLDDNLGQQVDGSTWPSASQQFTVGVPAHSHAVALVVSQGSFFQALNLWTLQRTGPAPTVLYRGPEQSSLNATVPPSGTLALSNTADGFSDTAAVTMQSATLGYFPPTSAPGPEQASQAVLSIQLDAEYPDNPDDPTTSGHYLGAQSPLPGSLLTFTPTGGSPVTATSGDPGETNGKGKADDGLFDATYSFVVPGNLTTGSLTINAGSFTGAEYTLFIAEAGTTSLNISGPLDLPLSFPAVPALATQAKPPWVGAPLPPTVSAASSSDSGTRPASGSSGFPIWLAVLLLVVVAAAIVLVQRRLSTRVRPAAASPDPAAPVVVIVEPTAVVSSLTNDAQPESPVASATTPDAYIADPSIRVLGPVEVHGWVVEPDRRVLEELLCFLVLHPGRSMSADQIQLALRPTNGTMPEVSRKTFHTYLSGLRRSIGADHLPDANADGYQVVDVSSDWAKFQALTREADRTDGDQSLRHLRAALSLVRGVPFEGVTTGQYEWVFNEQLASRLTGVVASCAIRLANELLDCGDYLGVDEAVRAGLRAAPDDADLWRIGAKALSARHEGRALRRHLRDAERHLEPDEMARLRTSLGTQAESDER